MASPISRGRMIRKDISRSQKIASLSKEAMVLFALLIPHFSSFGKMNGSAHFIKGEVVPLIDWFTVGVIEDCLSEISAKTNVKRFMSGGLWYIHSVNWLEHQELRKDRLGKDDMPDYSGTTPGLLPHEVEVEVEVKDEVEEKTCPEQTDCSEPEYRLLLKDGTYFDVSEKVIEYWEELYDATDVRREFAKMEDWCADNKNLRKRKTREGCNSFIRNWLNREDKERRCSGSELTSGNSFIENEIKRMKFQNGH